MPTFRKHCDEKSKNFTQYLKWIQEFYFVALNNYLVTIFTCIYIHLIYRRPNLKLIVVWALYAIIDVSEFKFCFFVFFSLGFWCMYIYHKKNKKQISEKNSNQMTLQILNFITSIQGFLLLEIWARTICFLHSWIGTWDQNRNICKRTQFHHL